jgi:hypothetical protein
MTLLCHNDRVALIDATCPPPSALIKPFWQALM